MYERFTDGARKVMQLANQEAIKMNHEYIGTEHILLGLIDEENKFIETLLERLGISRQQILFKIQTYCLPGPAMNIAGTLPSTPRTKKVIELAMGKARDWNDNFVGVEHLFMGVLRHTDGMGSGILTELGATAEKAEAEILLLRNSISTTGQATTIPTLAPELQEALDKLALVFGLSRTDHTLAIQRAMLCAETMIAVNTCMAALQSGN